MQTDAVIDLAREVVWQAMMLAGPPLAVALVVGAVIGVAQAVTQVQDATISLVPRIAAILLTLAVCAPWLLSQIMDFSQRMFGTVPSFVVGQ